MEAESTSHKGLRRFLETGKAKGLVGDVNRLPKMLAFVDAAGSRDELAVPPNYGVHPLVGERASSWSMTVTKNWHLLFVSISRGNSAIWLWRTTLALKMHSSLAVRVADWIKTELLEPQDIRVNTAAGHLGVSRQAISALLNGRCGLTAEMAIRFEKAFSVRAETLIRMQGNFDLAQARANTRNLCIQHFAPPNQADAEGWGYEAA